MNNLKNRGLEDILIAVVPSHRMQAFDCRVIDGLKGFPDAINAAYPDTTVQTCIVHLVRNSLNFCGWKDRKEVAKSLKVIYQAVDDEAAAKALPSRQIAAQSLAGQWMILKKNGVRNIPPSPRAGDGPGRRPSRFLSSRQMFEKLSIRQMLLKA